MPRIKILFFPFARFKYLFSMIYLSFTAHTFTILSKNTKITEMGLNIISSKICTYSKLIKLSKYICKKYFSISIS